MILKTENFIKQIDEAIEVRELIKITVLENADANIKELASEICEKGTVKTVPFCVDGINLPVRNIYKRETLCYTVKSFFISIGIEHFSDLYHLHHP